MAKNNNLKDFLTDVADAIREKKGTTDKINPQNFSDEIKNISGGGLEMKYYNSSSFESSDKSVIRDFANIMYYKENDIPSIFVRSEYSINVLAFGIIPQCKLMFPGENGALTITLKEYIDIMHDEGAFSYSFSDLSEFEITEEEFYNSFSS